MAHGKRAGERMSTFIAIRNRPSFSATPAVVASLVARGLRLALFTSTDYTLRTDLKQSERVWSIKVDTRIVEIQDNSGDWRGRSPSHAHMPSVVAWGGLECDQRIACDNRQAA